MKHVVRLPSSEVQSLSHMPFLAREGDLLTLIFCRSERIGRRVPQYSRTGTGRIWKLHWMQIDTTTGQQTPVYRLETGLEINEVECSPCLTCSQGQYHLSFIGTAHHGTGPLEHYLYTMSGPSLQELSPPVRVSQEQCLAGFHRPGLTALATGFDGKVQLLGIWPQVLETGFGQIARVSYCCDHPHHLLITGFLPEELERDREHRTGRTLLFDLQQQTLLGEVKVNGQPVYKPSLAGDALAYVDRTPLMNRGQEFLREQNQVHFSLQPQVSATDITVHLS